MRLSRRSLLSLALLVACTAFAAEPGAAAKRPAVPARPGTATLSAVYNLDYSTGAISTYSISGNQATLAYQFRLVSPKNGSTNGIATQNGLIYSAVDAPGGKPCTSCLMLLQPNGTLVQRVDAPKVKGAMNGPDITDVSVDARGDVFASDYGQQATYWFDESDSGLIGPFYVSKGTSDAASVAVAPGAKLVFVSGGCGFASARVFSAKRPLHKYMPGGCFGIGTIALIGGSADDAGDVATPIDGIFGLVSISNPNGTGYTLMLPDRMASVGSVAFSHDASVLYVADAKKEVIYAFAEPSGGWVSGQKPAHIATYKGFKHLDIIAVNS